MSDVEITFRLPEELIQRAHSEGVLLTDASIATMIELELRRIQAARNLTQIRDTLAGTLTPEEIEAELAAAKANIYMPSVKRLVGE